MPGGGAVTEAIGVVAEEGSAFGNPQTREWMEDFDLVRNLSSLLELCGGRLSNRLFRGRTFGVAGRIFDEVLIVVGAIEVGAMFPDITSHVVETKVVGGVALHCGGSLVAIEGFVVVWKGSLKGVRGPAILRGFGFLSPDEERVIPIAAGGPLPLCFSGEAFLRPLAIGLRIFLGDADHGMIHLVADGTFGAGGVLPVRSGNELPPLPLGAALPLFHFASGGLEDEGSGLELFCGGIGKVFFGEAALSLGLVAGGFHKFRKLGVGDFSLIDEK